MRPLLSPHNPIHLPLGLVIWSLWFVAVYAGLSVGCQTAPPASHSGSWTWLNLALLLGSVLTLMLLGSLALLFWRAGQRARAKGLEHYVPISAAAIQLIALVAVLFMSLPVLWMPPCL